MRSATEAYDFHVPYGRVLRGRALSLAVALREIALGNVSMGGPPVYYAPAWAVVTDRASGQEAFRVAAGREANAGPDLMARMKQDAEQMSPQEFSAKWSS